MTDLTKLDAGLVLALRDYERQASKSEPDKTISVILEFEGELTAVDGLGVAAAAIMGREAISSVRLADPARLAVHATVLRIAVGQRRRANLDFAVRDLHARASAASRIGTDGLWYAEAATGTLTGT